MLMHGITKTEMFTFIWAQGPCVDGKVSAWSETYYGKNPKTGYTPWGRTPGRAARALARHLDGISKR